jgi:hypothetical protein
MVSVVWTAAEQWAQEAYTESKKGGKAENKGDEDLENGIFGVSDYAFPPLVVVVIIAK